MFFSSIAQLKTTSEAAQLTKPPRLIGLSYSSGFRYLDISEAAHMQKISQALHGLDPDRGVWVSFLKNLRTML